jgi:diadenosine tetraphosphate (Ap4A) HIT family hydrolase
MEQVLVFRDINPQAPTHLLVIPKKREGLTQLRYAEADHASLLGHMLSTIAKVQLV